MHSVIIIIIVFYWSSLSSSSVVPKTVKFFIMQEVWICSGKYALYSYFIKN